MPAVQIHSDDIFVRKIIDTVVIDKKLVFLLFLNIMNEHLKITSLSVISGLIVLKQMFLETHPNTMV